MQGGNPIRDIIGFAILLVLIILTMIPGDLCADTYRLNLRESYPVIEAENSIWIGTPSGLYRYNPADDAYSSMVFPAGSESAGVAGLYYSDEWLWCIPAEGLAALHIRLNEWLYFDSAGGLPSDDVNGMDFDQDYAWAVTTGGAARYDLLVEEWETLEPGLEAGGRSVEDIVIDDQTAWLITARSIMEYDAQFERWRQYEVVDTAAAIDRAFRFGEDLWLVSNRGLIRFSTGLQTQELFSQPYLTPQYLLDLIVEDSTIWAVTTLGIYSYDPASSVWREFEGNANLEASRLVDAFVDLGQIWVLTDTRVMVWDRTDKDWEVLDYASGLSRSAYESVHASGGMVFLLSAETVDYRLSSEQSWRRYDIRPAAGVSRYSGREIFKAIFDNEAGSHIESGDYTWGLEGSRITLIQDYDKVFYDARDEEGAHSPFSKRLDVKSRLALGESRGMTGFYNDVDYSETMYGVRYRSRKDDILREFNWGDFRREPGAIPFGETASLFGSNVWLQAGPKTPRFKRSLLNLRGSMGERRSYKTYEHFKGAISRFEVTVRDVDYLRNQFYGIPGPAPVPVIDEIEIYVDDLNASSNTANTLEHSLIAGLVGDFDLLKATEDYYLYEKAGVVRFAGYVGPASTIVCVYTSGGQTAEHILQHAGVITEAKSNFYYLGAQQITPHSFGLTIRDSLGAEVPLGEFGIDANRDGMVDSDWIDYEGGILFFPQDRPFPTEVYDASEPRSFYRIEAEFETRLSLIQLAYTDLVRGTETLMLDGVAAGSGTDYVLDYTNGTLVFVREGIVNDDTRIEVEYEYYAPAETDQTAGVAMDYSPSDNFYLQTEWLRLEGMGAEGDSVSNLLTMSGEVRHSIRSLDLRLIPGLTYDPDGSLITGRHLEGLLGSSRFRFQAAFEAYNDAYRNFHRPEFILGKTKRRLNLFGSTDLTQDLRLSGEWKREDGFGASPAQDRSAKATVLLHRRGWPGWEISYYDFETDSGPSGQERHFIQSRWEYRLPGSVMERLRLEGMKAEAWLRTGSESDTCPDAPDRRFRQGYVRLNTNVSDRFQTSVFYRRNDLDGIDGQGGQSSLSRSERLLLSLSHEQWRILQMNLRAENTLDQGFHRGSFLTDARLSRYAQVNLRMSPGPIWDLLRPLYFEANMSHSLSAWGQTPKVAGRRLWRVFTVSENSLGSLQLTKNFYVKNEMRPGPRWSVRSLVEWNHQQTEQSLSSLEAHYWKWTEEADISVGYKTQLDLQYIQFSQDLGYARSLGYSEPSIWIEHRWTPDFQNTFNMSYRYSRSDDGSIHDTSDEWETGYDLVFRKQRVAVVRAFEFRQAISGKRLQAEGANPESTYRVTSSSSLDLYPLHSTILRLQVDVTRYRDRLVAENDYTELALNLKASLRF